VSPPPARPACAVESGGRNDILPLVPHLRAYARSLVGGDPHAADDLVQDTVVLALRAWDRFTPGTNLQAWLFRILRDRHLSVRGREHRRAEVGVEDLSPFGSVPAFQEGRAELRHFKAAFARLAPSHREVLVLWAVHGLPYEAIAEVTGGNVGTVKSRINRARTALKAMVLGERPIGGRVVTPPPTRPKARVESPADPPARRAARPAERCTAEALEGLARLSEDILARGEAEASPEVARRSFALLLAYRQVLPREMPG
jgi:RNA polymerase sigma-70 factor, ECF subfamily